MKQKLYSFLLLALIGLLGSNVQVMAQDIPEPAAQWNFNNADDLMAPDKGSLQMIPAVLGTRSVTVSTLSAAGIVPADGPDETNKAIFVPATAALKVLRADGSAASQSYTLMLDVMVEDAAPYDGLLQTDPNNGNDGDLFIHNNTVGVGSLGYGGNVKNNHWNRFVLTYRDGKNILYQNGDKIVEANPDNNDRFKIQPFGFYLFCDEDGEKNDTYVAGVAFWETALSAEQIKALGGYKEEVKNFEIGSEADLLAFADYVNSNRAANGVLTADIALSNTWQAPIGIDGAPFTGTFDGQGHKITGFKGVSTGKFGLFGFISNADVKNFSIEGTLEATAAHGTGAIGWSAASRITNVHSALNINVAELDVHHVGGVVGSAQSQNRITGCTFSGTLTEAAGNNDCFAGIAGYMSADTILYCTNYGTVTYTVANGSVGGIAGYLNNNSGMMKGCLNMGKVAMADEEATPTYGGAFIGWLRSNTPGNMQGNCWLEGSAPHANGQGAMNDTFAFTADQLPTGIVCFKLNGDQSEIAWYQTIGTDQAPVLDPTHGQVYMNGRKHCNGDVYSDATYSNTYSEITQDDHDFVDGYCSYCDLFDDNYTLPADADGVYQISSPNQLRRFAALVNSGSLKANAVLVNDIDFADVKAPSWAWTPIGSWTSTPAGSACFQGHFDGQGHTIKNFNVSSNQNFYGLFGVISTDCLIENFSIYGTINVNVQYAGGVAAYSRDDRPVIRNIHSFVNINNTSAGGRQGGILGGAHSTTFKTVIENCIYSGTLDGNDAGGSGNYGGIVGYINNNGNTIVDITNCLFDGKVVNNNPTPGGCTFGGFVGYSNGAVVTIKNSLSIGKVDSKIWGMFFGAVKSNKSSLPNSYYMGEIVNGSASTVTLAASETNADELESGKICWQLNEGEFLDAAWRQVLGEQEQSGDEEALPQHPVPYGGEGIVYEFGEEDYKNLSDEVLEDFISDISEKEELFVENTKAYQTLLDEYGEVIESWEDITTLDAFLDAYRSAFELKESIKTSAANYEAYANTCQDAANYIKENNLEGEYTDFLKAYLEEVIAPNANYPNGSYGYILETLSLDDEGIAAEIAFVSQMLENAIAGGLTPGTEITRLLTNPDFADGYEGWAVETEGGTATVAGITEIMPIPEGYNNSSFTAYQILSELPNGIYMLAANGLFRTGGDIYSTFYAGQLYLNNTVNYFMAPSEDVISEDEAVPGVNCIGEGTDAKYEGDIIGWVPQGRDGCSVAFSAGRYQNFVATEVTDGKLAVGVRNMGTGLSGDWLPFGNIHVFYLGSAQEADKTLTKVLEGYVARAQTILNFDWTDDDTFSKYPNMSEQLKEELGNAMMQAENPQDKMALIGTFSALFDKVLECRKAYIAMFDAVNKLYDTLNELSAAGVLSDESYAQWENEVMEAQDHYFKGDVSTQEALAIAQHLLNSGIMPKPVDGVYQLKSAADLAIFSLLVNKGSLDADAVLLDDIDFADLGEGFAWSAIGNWASSGIAYKGHFDGQGHTIKNFNVTSDRNFFGLFGVLSDNALVENFNIYGELYTTYQSAGGVVGFARDNNVTIRDIHSYVNIHNTSVSGRQGGILGCSNDGTITVERCTYSGTLESNDNGNGGNYGGIVGYTNNSTNAVCNIIDCLFDGRLYNSADVPGNCTFGGMVGYTNSSRVTIQNCLSIGKVESARYAQFFGALNGANSKIFNSYYKGDYINGSSSGQRANPQEAFEVTDAQLASGEVCFKLNSGIVGDGGQSQNVSVWFQTLAADAYPVLEKDHLKVWFYDGAYTNNDPDGIREVEAGRPALTDGQFIYNLAGQRLEKLQKGLNIVGGKKILVK